MRATSSLPSLKAAAARAPRSAAGAPGCCRSAFRNLPPARPPLAASFTPRPMPQTDPPGGSTWW